MPSRSTYAPSNAGNHTTSDPPHHDQKMITGVTHHRPSADGIVKPLQRRDDGRTPLRERLEVGRWGEESEGSAIERVESRGREHTFERRRRVVPRPHRAAFERNGRQPRRKPNPQPPPVAARG